MRHSSAPGGGALAAAASACNSLGEEQLLLGGVPAMHSPAHAAAVHQPPQLFPGLGCLGGGVGPMHSNAVSLNTSWFSPQACSPGGPAPPQCLRPLSPTWQSSPAGFAGPSAFTAPGFVAAASP